MGEMELNVEDTFVAPAGTMHSLRSDGDLYVVAVLIPVEKIQEITGAGTECGKAVNNPQKKGNYSYTAKIIKGFIMNGFGSDITL